MDWSAIRKEFPALSSWTYLNSATYGQLPLRAQQAVAKHFQGRDVSGCTDFMTWFDDAFEVRELIASLINCAATDIAFVNTAAAALSLFLGGIDWREGDRILTLADEFPNQFYYAKWLESRGAELIEVNSIEQIPERTRAVAISSVNYTSGYRPDVRQIADLTHDAGAILYVDATQSLGALRFDIAQAKPDMLACDPYKWLMAPNGASFLYASPELRQRLAPAVFGWRSDKGWRGVDELNKGVPQLSDDAEKYEGGMLNFPSIYGLGETLRMVHDIGMEAIEKRVLDLSRQTCEICQSAGAQIVNNESNIVAARFPDRDATALSRSLAKRKIVTAARYGNLRVSPHFYNDESDLKIFAEALHDR